jgi:hypothetical protein
MCFLDFGLKLTSHGIRDTAFLKYKFYLVGVPIRLSQFYIKSYFKPLSGNVQVFYGGLFLVALGMKPRG